MTPLEILAGLANGNYHRPGAIRALRVGDLSVSRFEALRAELLDLVDEHPPSHVGQGHVTGWTQPTGTVCQWSLYNRHGDTANPCDDFSYVLDGKQVVEGAPQLARFADGLPALVNLRLNMLAPGAALAPHEEHLPFALPGDQVGLRARFHLPIDTNPDALMLADGDWYRFHPGCVYLFNNGCIHAASNAGATRRLHLVWDQLLTERACQVMFDQGNDWLAMDLDTVPVVKRSVVTDWQQSRGMSAREFDRRRLVHMP